MPALTPARIAARLAPYLGATTLPPDLFTQLSVYLDLLMKWNARTNLTAIRDPETIVSRHFGESLFLAAHLPPETRTVLDLGSGAGFPGLPLHLLRPDLAVTLAESQGKKSAFLREAVRSLGLATRVHAGRAEDLALATRYDLVTLRAVDHMSSAMDLAATLGIRRLVLTTAAHLPKTGIVAQQSVPESADGVLALF